MVKLCDKVLYIIVFVDLPVLLEQNARIFKHHFQPSHVAWHMMVLCFSQSMLLFTLQTDWLPILP